MKKFSLLSISLILIFGLAAGSGSEAQTPTPSKRRTVYSAAPAGSLLGGGYADAGDSKANSQRASTLSLSDNPNFRSALNRFNAHAGTVVEGYSLIAPAVKLQTGVPTETIKRQHEVTGLTYGELLVANSLATGSGKKFNEIIALKNKGGSWSQISKQLGINIDSITTRLNKAEESIRFAQGRRRDRRNQNVGDVMRNLGQHAGLPPGG